MTKYQISDQIRSKLEANTTLGTKFKLKKNNNNNYEFNSIVIVYFFFVKVGSSISQCTNYELKYVLLFVIKNEKSQGYLKKVDKAKV